MTEHEIKLRLEERVDEILAAMQREKGIITGDVDPETAMHMDETLDKLTSVIVNMIAEQKRYNEGGY